MNPKLQFLEVEPIVLCDNDFAVENASSGQLRIQRLEQLGKVSIQRFRIAALNKDFVPKLQEEIKVMELGLEALARIGVKPRTYRAPYWDFSENTLGLLERYGFEIDSSLLANDFHPYWIRPVEVHAERGNVFGPPGRILEIPGQWYLTDFSQAEFIPGFQEGMLPSHDLLARWT